MLIMHFSMTDMFKVLLMTKFVMLFSGINYNPDGLSRTIFQDSLWTGSYIVPLLCNSNKIRHLFNMFYLFLRPNRKILNQINIYHHGDYLLPDMHQEEISRSKPTACVGISITCSSRFMNHTKT